ncbi:MAG: hypothetical protein A2097_03615 [Desulfobacula sp. GWF2_41_7]|nr:MAG: hypothetical protein A2097_03615 [Desulfobacula sp. GWF2_41_7]
MRSIHSFSSFLGEDYWDCLDDEGQAHLDIPVFFVRDNGIGIQEKYRDTIFKIFKRLHGRDKYGGGTGSGLTIVRKIIERHGGRIWVESEFGRGSTFYFTLMKNDKEICI